MDICKFIHKNCHVTVLLYHLVFSAKYRKIVFDAGVESVISEVCLEIESDEEHIHFLVESVPTYSIKKLVTMIKILIAREIFKKCPHVKKQLWGGEFWSDGYFAVQLVNMGMNQ